ncbi:hypothetical protein FXF92_10025 [Salmonella enterica subsp. enterica]|nr:hypothetical protein [Salmonella enterica subsp. enterica]
MPDGAAAYSAYRLYRFVGRIRCLRRHPAIILIRSSYKSPPPSPVAKPLHALFHDQPTGR